MIRNIIPFALIALISCGQGKTSNEEKKSDESKENSPKQEQVEQATTEEKTEEVQEIEVVQQEELTIESYAQYSTREALGAAFSEEYLKDDTAWYAEGTVAIPCTFYKSAENDRAIKFLWSEDGSLDAIECYSNIYNADYEVVAPQKITSECGIYTGMTLKDLVEWNGAEIQFAGFGWDYEGNILSSNEGKLADCKVSIRMGLEMDNYQELDNKYLGDITLSSSDEGILDASIVIGEMTYHLKD